MATVDSGAVQQQLEQINAQIPESIAGRVTSAIVEVEASGAAPGLAPGEQAPEFSLPDALERSVSLRERVSGGPVVLVFYRGEWCPYCNAYLRALQAALPEITARGASLLAVSPQSPDHSLSITEKAQLGFDVLSDVDQAVGAAYETKRHPDESSPEYAKRRTFLIDPEGVIRKVYRVTDIPEHPDEVLADLRTLQSGR